MLVAAFSLLALAQAAAPPPSSCVSLPEAVSAALGTSPVTAQANAQREVARARVLAAQSQRMPQVQVFGQTGIGDRQPLDQSRDDQVGVSANLELFSFGQRSAAITAARETLRAAQAGELQAQVQIAEQAILLFFELLRTQATVDLSRAQAENYSAEAETVEKRLERGLVTRSDARQIEARYAGAIARREEAEISRDEIAVQLSILVGVDIPCAEEASARALGEGLQGELGGVTAEEALALAEGNAMRMRQARANVYAAEARLREANRAGRPTVSVNAFVLGNYNDSELPFDNRWEQEDRVGFSLRQELYAGGRLKADRAERRGQLRSARADLEGERQQLEYEVRRAILGAQRQGVVTRQRMLARTAAEDRLEATRMELERGTKTITDFVLANEDYYAAAIEEVAASYARDEELVRLAAATGLLLDIDLDRAARPENAPDTLGLATPR